MTTYLYDAYVAKGEDSNDEREALMFEVWSPTPWIVDVNTGSMSDMDRYYDILSWCNKMFGPESYPIHGKNGDWHHGSATINGWTWMGFKTKELMDTFIKQWGEFVNE